MADAAILRYAPIPGRNKKTRLAVVRDFREEHWPSMDLAADMLLEQLALGGSEIDVADIGPPFRSMWQRLPIVGRLGASRNVDRLWNRFVTLPRAVRRQQRDFDAFHIVDHSYAHLVHDLPPGRTGVYCHDLDTFRSVLEPETEARPFWFRAMSRRILTGLKQAAIVFHNSRRTGEELLRWNLVEPERLRIVPLGVAPEFTPQSSTAMASGSTLPELRSAKYLLHVGSCIPRKRIDVLLDVFAQLHRKRPELLLVKAGDPWTPAQALQIEQLGIGDSICHLGKRSRPELAEAMRSAAAVVVPSEAEGFGLPVIEALACGTEVVASDIPALREAGGEVAVYAKAGDRESWVDNVDRVLGSPAESKERDRRLAWAAQFTWQRHARTIAAAYSDLIATK